MKFSCGLAPEALVKWWNDEAAKLREWEKIFLWFPTTTHVEGDREICQWLCFVERRYPNATARDSFGRLLNVVNVMFAKIYKLEAEYREVQK